MCTIKKAMMCSCIMIFLFACEEVCSVSYAQSVNNNLTKYEEWYDDVNNEYIFPIDADSEDWKNLNSHQEMIDACTIPENLIESLSTNELYELVIKYPLLIDMFAYNSENQGFEVIRKYFNGLEALLCREDIVNTLLDAYSNIELSSKNQDNFDTLCKIQFLELMLTDEDIVNKMSATQKNKLSELAYENYCKKQTNDLYTNCEGKLYEYANNNGTLNDINNIKKSVLNTNINYSNLELYNPEDLSLLGSLNTTFIRTPKGSKVIVILNKKYDEKTLQNFTEASLKQYPNATLIYPANNKYNCHSYAWYWQSKYNSYWINGSEAELYVTDGSYRAISSYPLAAGQKVVWYDYDWEGKVNFMHSGILRSFKSPNDKTGIMIESKWTKGPVMLHEIDYSPYGHSNSSYLYYIRN